MQLAPLRHIKVADQLTDTLLDRLRTGVLKRGARLRSEHKLAANPGVSRSSLRGTLPRLELPVHLEVRPGDDTAARTPDADTLTGPFHDLLWALLKFRPLKPEVAALTARRRDTAGAAALRASLARQQTRGPDSTQLVRKDLLFHHTLARLAGNVAVLRDLRAVSRFAADPEAARAAMRGHLEEVVQAHGAALRGSFFSSGGAA